MAKIVEMVDEGFAPPPLPELIKHFGNGPIYIVELEGGFMHGDTYLASNEPITGEVLERYYADNPHVLMGDEEDQDA